MRELGKRAGVRVESQPNQTRLGKFTSPHSPLHVLLLHRDVKQLAQPCRWRVMAVAFAFTLH